VTSLPIVIETDLRIAVLESAVRDALGVHYGKSTIDVEDLCPIMSWGRSTAYDAVRRGVVPSIKIGRRVVVPVPALVALLLGAEVDA